MKLKDGFFLHETPDGVVAVAAGEAGKSFNGMIRLNGTAAFIARQLLSETDEDAVLSAVLEKYDVDEARAREDIARVIAAFRQADLLVG